jgi:hypothetical protein
MKKGKKELAFIRGNELSNDQYLFQIKNRNQIYGIEFEMLSYILSETVNKVIQEIICCMIYHPKYQEDK